MPAAVASHANDVIQSTPCVAFSTDASGRHPRGMAYTQSYIQIFLALYSVFRSPCRHPSRLLAIATKRREARRNGRRVQPIIPTQPTFFAPHHSRLSRPYPFALHCLSLRVCLNLTSSGVLFVLVFALLRSTSSGTPPLFSCARLILPPPSASSKGRAFSQQMLCQFSVQSQRHTIWQLLQSHAALW